MLLATTDILIVHLLADTVKNVHMQQYVKGAALVLQQPTPNADVLITVYTSLNNWDIPVIIRHVPNFQKKKLQNCTIL